MNNSLKTLPNQIIQSLANKLITNSDIQRAFFKDEVGDCAYDKEITKDNLTQYFFTKKMMDNFVDKIANWVKKVLDYEDEIKILKNEIKILTNKNNKLQIDLSNQIDRYKKDISMLANEIGKNKQNSVKQIEYQEKEIQKLKKENAKLRAIISKEQQERQNMANECRKTLKKTEQNNKPIGESGPQIKKSQIVPTKRQPEKFVKAINGLLSKEIEYKSQLFNKNLPPINREEIKRLLSKDVIYKSRFLDQIHQNNLPMKNLSKKTKNKNSKINNNDNYIYIEENPYRN